MLASLVLFLATLMFTNGDVLDPALFLAPSPPLTSNFGSITPGEGWTSVSSSVVKEAENRISGSEYEDTPTEKAETMENAETFWPKFRTSSYGLSPPHIPLTFSITGTYGGRNPYGTGVVGSSYASISADEDDDGKRLGFGSYGKSGLAGSSYGSYGYPGIRVFSSSTKLGWSGWGNGKWGHYGKG